MNPRRLVIATLSGILCGFICYGFASSGGYPLALPIALQIIFGRTLIGLAIGISVLNHLAWYIHGPLLGGIFSLPMAFSGMIADVPGFSKTSMFLSTVVMGVIYGFLIELITTVVFKEKIGKK